MLLSLLRKHSTLKKGLNVLKEKCMPLKKELSKLWLSESLYFFYSYVDK